MRIIFVLLIIGMIENLHSEEMIPEIEINEITQNVYLHKSYQHVKEYGLVSSNGLIVIDESKNAFLIDTPWSEKDTDELVNWIKTKGYQLKGSLSTHWHADRTTGIKKLNALSIPTYVSALTNEKLKMEGKVLATHRFKGREFSLGNGLIEIYYPGAGHTTDNIVVWLPQLKILFGGCLVKSLKSTGLGNIKDASIKQWPESINKLIAQYSEAKMIVPGHGPTGNIDLLEHTKSLLGNLNSG